MQLLKPTSPRAHAWQQEKPPQREAHKSQLEQPLLEVTRKKAHTAMETQYNPKNSILKNTLWLVTNYEKEELT